MRAALFNTKAAKQTVSVTLNSDLYAKAKNLGINASQVAEEALSQTLARRLAEQVKVEIRQDLDAYNTYVAEHGSPAELTRAYYRDRDDAV